MCCASRTCRRSCASRASPIHPAQALHPHPRRSRAGVHYNPYAKALLHLFATICICANIFVVSIITFVSVWGSGKALRGRDGSMATVIEGMNQERWLIFLTFGVGLLSLLSAVACSTWLLMQWEVAGIATALLVFTCYALVSSGFRIFKSTPIYASSRSDSLLELAAASPFRLVAAQLQTTRGRKLFASHLVRDGTSSVCVVLRRV